MRVQYVLVRASHIAFYLQCHSGTSSAPSGPVISLSTCSAIPELVRPCQSYRFLLAVPFRNSFGRASHIAFYLKCHSGTGSAVPVISLSTCSAIPELSRPCQSYRFLLEVPFRNSFGRASHIAFYCSAIPELVRPCQSYRFLLEVPFQNSFGRASHIAFYLQCHSITRSAVPVISLSTCSAIPELVRPCQSYRFLLEVPFRNSFGRVSHIAFYLQCHSGTGSAVPVISLSTCSAIPQLVTNEATEERSGRKQQNNHGE